MTILRRSIACEIRADAADPSMIELSASSEYAVQRGRYREILLHGEKNVRSIAQAALFNHDPDQVIGSVARCGVAPDKTVRASIKLLDGARLPSGVLAADAVKAGALRGVSIGYSIDKYDRSEKDGQVEIRATEWTLREISLTPIPADPTVGIGRSEDDATFASLFTSTPPADPAKERNAMSDALPTEPQAPAAVLPTADAIRAEAKTIATQAEALGLRAADFAGLPLADARSAMLDAVAKRGAAAPVPSVQVTADRNDKLVDAMGERLAGLVGEKRSADPRAILAIGEEHARACGIHLRNDSEVAGYIRKGFLSALRATDQRTGRERGLVHQDWLDAGKRAVEVSANFTLVAGLASTKMVLEGMEYMAPESDKIVRKRTASDFKSITVAGLQTGDFSSPSEGSAFSDLTIDDAGGTGTLVMRGAGLELSKQALYNDDLSLFLDKLRGVGRSAALHQDKLVATALSGAAFTAATSALALSAANLKTAWTALANVTGPAGEKLSVTPRLLVVPNDLYLTAVELTTLAQGATTENALASNSAFAGRQPLTPVRLPHLTDTNDWYLMADPMDAAALHFVTHTDYQLPQIFEVDPGLVASRKFRIEYPTVVIVGHLNPGTNTKPVGAYKCTQP
ncbi:MAG: hypothetical protein RLZZ524_2617 [Pseudomonadota bacterium]|jgi:HK97 family phage prohead protease